MLHATKADLQSKAIVNLQSENLANLGVLPQVSCLCTPATFYCKHDVYRVRLML